MLALFAVSFVVLVAIYVAATLPGAWFPRAEAKSIAYRDLSLSKGSGRVLPEPHKGEALAILAPDETGLAVVSAVADLRSAEYPIVAWQADGLPDSADATLLWRNDYAPDRSTRCD